MMPALTSFEITVAPHPYNAAQWGWSVRATGPGARVGDVVEGGNTYGSADAAKAAAEECADSIAAAIAVTETYTYTPQAVK